MNQHKLTFESEKLVVDYISFNITDCTDPLTIATYLSNSFGFNSVVRETFQGKDEDLIFEITNEYKVSFIKSTYSPESHSYWTGFTVRFSGKNGEYFYSLVQKKSIDWSIFDLTRTNIGRFDLYYFRESKSADQDEPPELFMKNSCKKISSEFRRKESSWNDSKKGLIMKIGNRPNSNYYRVYQKRKKITHDVYDDMNYGLEFEMELKNQLIQSFQKLLFNNHLGEFEAGLVEHFYKYSAKIFVLDTCYTDWLQIGLRKMVSNQKSKINLNFLVSSYLKKNDFYSFSFAEKKQFFKLIQFLSFMQNLKCSKQFLNDQAYCVVEFTVIDFMLFTGGNIKSTYQRTKALEFLTSLQDLKPLIRKFSDNEFRRSVIFPYLKLTKQGRQWNIIMAIGEDFYYYQYPFLFPNSFIVYKNKYDLQIKFQLIEAFSQIELKKKFPVEEFLNQFSISNKDLTKVKNQLIDSLLILKDSKLIRDEFLLIPKNGSSSKVVVNLSSALISRSKYIYFWEKYS